jgi:hypothetical protein
MPVPTGGAFKKMSQRAMWRGDRSQSEMIANHGMEGVRQNLLRDTPTYKKEAVGFKMQPNSSKKIANTNNANGSDRNNNTNTKVKNSQNSNSQNKSNNLGSSILNSL